MKTYKNIGFGPRKSKGGFTLIELLIVMVILAILAGVVVMAVGGVFGTAKSSAYNAVKDDIQNAVVAYATDNQGSFPYNISATTFTNANCSTCYVLNMSKLLTANGGMLRQIPDGCADLATLDNCDGIPAGQEVYDVCKATNHYLWGADSKGNVYSFCDDTGAPDKLCTSNNSGYQGQFP
ncbi:MAG: prepilin-type N-terminal cleavage/methylation domain-containing protein [Dehalococcoidia bacterium]|jgi:type II secretory pathway pseudopilin PulG